MAMGPPSTYDYDVVLSYSARDAEAVVPFEGRLREYGVHAFIDDMSPGVEWPETLQAALSNSRSVAIFVGPFGLNPKRIDEITLLAESIDRPVIPVLLPGASSKSLPEALASRICVDFSQGVDDPQAWELLVQTIRGQVITSPAPSAQAPSTSSSIPERPLFDRLSPRARNAVRRADRFRRSKRNERIHMEHLVVGLVDEGDEPVLQAFKAVGLDRSGLIAILDKAQVNLPSDSQPYKPSNATSLPRLSGHAEQALTEAARLAKSAGSPEIGTAHLLQAVCSVKDCEVVTVLLTAGIQPEPAPTGKEPDPPLDEVSVQVASTRDQPADTDSLGFQPYVDAVAKFLVNEETRPPLTLSIEGEWGSGKSSFMLQLEKALMGHCKPFRGWISSLPNRLAESWRQGRKGRWPRLRGELVAPCCLTVRFNAWRHDKEDALWAAFASEFLRRISRERSLPRRWVGHFRLFLGRYRWRDGWLEMLRAVAVWSVLIFLGLAVPVAATRAWPAWSSSIEKRFQDFGKEAAKNPAANQTTGSAAVSPGGATKEAKADPLVPFFTWLVGLGGLGAYGAGVISLALKVKEVIGNPVKVNLRKYLSSPDYDGHAAFVESFHKDFQKIVSAYAGNRKVYVFIDDLDRCEVPKAADLMQALNLLIADDPRLIFIIGMDREKVAAGLAVKYEKLLPYLMPESVAENGTVDPRAGLEYGYTFIEKFIQLPFRVPSPQPANLLDFLAVLSRHPAAAVAPAPVGAGDGVANVASDKASSAERTTGSSDKPQAPPPVQVTANPDSAQKQARREQFRLVLRDDSETLRETALMVAPALENNPRRLKQFVNLFRLRTYIAFETGAFDEVGGSSLTIQQMGKFVAISLVWPGLLTDFAENRDLLLVLQKVAFKQMDSDWEPNVIESRWVRQPALLALLRFGCEGRLIPTPPEPFNLAHADLDRLLRVSPKVIRTRISTEPVLRPTGVLPLNSREESYDGAQRGQGSEAIPSGLSQNRMK